MNNIVELSKEEPVVSHRMFADYVDMEQEHISRLLRKHREDFEEFGVLGFEIRADSEMKLKNPDSKPLKTYFLNEQQATLLMTYMKNTDKVREFKKKLVKEFYNMREKLIELRATKKALQFDDTKAPLAQMFTTDFEDSFKKVIGEQRADAVYKRILGYEPKEHKYQFITGVSKRWFVRGDKIYVQGAIEKGGEFKRYSTGLKTTDENLQWIDADNNALDLLHKLHDEKLNKEG